MFTATIPEISLSLICSILVIAYNKCISNIFVVRPSNKVSSSNNQVWNLVTLQFVKALQYLNAAILVLEVNIKDRPQTDFSN